jgi:RES domain-containing protein
LTPEDLALDPEILLRDQPIRLYRVARRKYANLSGAGASLYPGRWNRPEQEAIYTSTEISVPVLERLVHTPKDVIPSNLALMTIQMSGEWEVHDDELVDVDTLARLRIFRSLAEAKSGLGPPFISSWYAVALPSVIVPVWNVVLYPENSGFWKHISLESVEPFEFDPRLFPEGAPVEGRG